MKQVLVVAYAFPPCGGAGVQRTAKLVRYLPEFGWMPTVLTVVPSCYGIKDSSHTDEMRGGVEVIRTHHVDVIARFSRTPAPAHNNRGPNGSSRANGNGAGPNHFSLKKASRALARGGWLLLERTMMAPDPAVLWCPKAIAAGLSAHQRRNFDLIYATGEPYSDYLTAFALSRMTGVPFVIDMRDPWTLAPYRKEIRSTLRRSIEGMQEHQVLSSCRAALFANKASSLYADAFPQWSAKFHYVPNGYDSEDFDGVEPRRFDKFTIVHSGTFLPGYRTADSFLHSMKALLSRRPRLSERLQVIFVGKSGVETDLIARLSLGGVVEQTGYLPHRESLSYLKGADLLLLVGGEHRWEETGKVYEYMACGKPVLAMVNPDGSAADLLRQYGRSVIVDREDTVAAASALEQVIQDPCAFNPFDNGWVARFERRHLAGRIAEIFSEAL